MNFQVNGGAGEQESNEINSIWRGRGGAPLAGGLTDDAYLGVGDGGAAGICDDSRKCSGACCLSVRRRARNRTG